MTRKEQNAAAYEKRRKAKRPKRFCIYCRKKIHPEQNLKRDVCLREECMDWWKSVEVPRRARARTAKWAKNARRVGKIKPKKKATSWGSDDFTQEKFIEKLKKNKARNGRTCMAKSCKTKCVGPFYYCAEHRRKNYRIADIVRVDGFHGGGEGNSKRAFMGVA